jgi:hypothetical protein
MWTAMPVQITQDTKEGHVCQAQPTIKGKHTKPDGTTEDVEMPLLGSEVPIQFSGGGGFTITHPIKKSDEGIAIFAARALDNWWDKGGIQTQCEQRRHDLSDAMYIPGIRSKPRKLGGNGSGGGSTPTALPWLANGTDLTIDLRDGQQQTAKVSLDTLQIRTDKGDVYVEITGDSINIICPATVTVKCKEMDVTATDKVAITSPLVTMSQDLQVGGKISAGGQISSGADVHAAGDVHAGDSSGVSSLFAVASPAIGGDISLNWSQTGLPDSITGIAPGVLNVVSQLGTNVSTIGDNFTISGAVNFITDHLGNMIPGDSSLINQAHTVMSIISSQNFSAALSAIPGQIGHIGGAPSMSAIVSLLGHLHHGVQSGPAISSQPVTGT